MIQKQDIETIISVCGWLYFIIWSVSFYPQVFLLLKQKSAMGMSSNYIFINLTGYVMYSAYNLYGLIKGDNPQTGKVEHSDILFSIHSVLLYSVTAGLFFYFPHQIQLSLFTKLYLAIQWVVFLYFGLNYLRDQNALQLELFGIKTNIGYFQTLGYFKMFSTLLKHPPQIYYNFKRKSTRGWSIQGMIMDFLGGFFSLIALVLQLYINPKLHINVAKLFLSVMSMIYDMTYMVQHFVLYGDKQADTQRGIKQRVSPRTNMPKLDQQQKKFLKSKQSNLEVNNQQNKTNPLKK